MEIAKTIKPPEIDRSKFVSMTIKQKIDAIHRIKIKHPKIRFILKKMERCHKSSERAGDPEHLFITGNQGLGKTTLCKIYLKRYPRIQCNTDDRIPVLYARTPPLASIKNLASTLLAVIGDPKADKGTTLNMTTRLRKYVTNCGIKLIILDEFQHFSIRSTQANLYKTADWLKSFIEDTNTPLALIGLPESKQILTENRQLNRRFYHRCEILPYDWHNPLDKKDFHGLLYTIDQSLPFTDPLNLASGDMPARFFFASDGIIGNLMKLIRFAAQVAVENGHSIIKNETYVRVFQEQIHPEMPGKENPFISNNFYIEKKSNNNYDDQGGVNNRIKPSKKEPGLEVIRT
jgi:hypothetical protein